MGADPEPSTGSTLLVLLHNPADARAWSAFVDRYGPLIYGWCRRWRLQPADAENVTQEVLTLLVRKLAAFRYDAGKGTFRGWLRTLARHAWQDYLDGQRRPGAGSGDTALLEQLGQVEAREDLLQALAEAFDLELLEEARARVQLRVSPRDWQIFQELAVEGRPGPAVARDRGMTVAAVLMARSRVQQKLCDEVQRLENEDPANREAAS